MKTNKKPYKRIAFVLSLCMIVVWGLLGTGASLAWFSDTSPEVKNIFHFGTLDLVVFHRLDDGTYEEIDGQTDIFDDEALYEPGYVQVVYLKIENRGTVPLNFKAAVHVAGDTAAVNAFGEVFRLQNYLKFGLVTADTEQALEQKVASRELAKEIAVMKLNNYVADTAELAAKDTAYAALIVRMPKEVGNDANYRGDIVPTVDLGLIVSAVQQTN